MVSSAPSRWFVTFFPAEVYLPTHMEHAIVFIYKCIVYLFTKRQSIFCLTLENKKDQNIEK